MSQHVRRLERDVGLPLVIKIGRGLVLTDAGQILLRHADAVAAGLAAADQAMADLAGLHSGRVRLAVFPSASATLVPAAVSSLAVVHPGIDVRLTQVEPPDALALLARGEVDVAVVSHYPDEPDLDSHAAQHSLALLDDHLYVILPITHPLAERPSVPLSALAGERWIAGCPRCQQHLLRSAARAGFTPDIHHSTDDYVVVQSLVAAGTAVAVLPRLALAASRHPDVRVVPLTDHPPRVVSLRLHGDTQTNPAIAATIDHLRRASDRHLSRQRGPSPP